MATSYSTNLALALPVTGELSGTWGTTVNSSITNMLDEALGYQAYTATGGADTITIPDGATGVARSIYIQLNGTGGGSVAVPTSKTKMYFVFNNTGSSITFKVTGQTGVSIPSLAKIALVSNGTDIIVAQNYFAALTLGAALPVASGGTGATSTTFVNLATNVTGTLPIVNGGTGTTSTTFANLATNVTGTLPVANGGTSLTTLTANNVILGNGASAPTFVAPSTSGNVLTSNGTTWQSTASVAGSLVFLSSQTVTTAVASVDFTSGIDATYDNYYVVFSNFVVASGGRLGLRLRQSTTFKSADYANFNLYVASGGVVGSDFTTTNTFLMANNGGTPDSNSYWSGYFTLSSANNATRRVPAVNGYVGCIGDTSASSTIQMFTGAQDVAGVITGFQLLSRTGSNLTAGTVALYGIKQ